MDNEKYTDTDMILGLLLLAVILLAYGSVGAIEGGDPSGSESSLPSEEKMENARGVH